MAECVYLVEAVIITARVCVWHPAVLAKPDILPVIEQYMRHADNSKPLPPLPQIGLLAVALIPLMGAAAVVQMQMMNGTYEKKEGLDGGAEAGVILGGALNGVSTVTAFNMQRSTAEKYDEVCEHEPMIIVRLKTGDE